MNSFDSAVIHHPAAAVILAVMVLVGLFAVGLRYVDSRAAQQRDLATDKLLEAQARVKALTGQLAEVTSERDALRRLTAPQANWDSTWLDALGIPELSQRGGDET